MDIKTNISSEILTLGIEKPSWELAGELYDNWGSDKETFKTISSPPIQSIHMTLNVLHKAYDAYLNNDFYRYVVFYDDEPAGFITLTPQKIGNKINIKQNDKNITVNKHNAIEIGLSLGSKFWNKGLASEAINLLTDNLDTHLPIFATVREGNFKSEKLLNKNGFEKVLSAKRDDIYLNHPVKPEDSCSLYFLNFDKIKFKNNFAKRNIDFKP